MAKVEIYTRPMCGFCFQAKRLLTKKDVTFTEYNIWEEKGRKEEMERRSNGGATVPQIFIDDELIGGCTELMDLERHGKLDAKLSSPAA